MKVAIFSDIHGNREALISIIKDIKKEGIKKLRGYDRNRA